MTVRPGKSSLRVFQRRMLEEPTKRTAFCGGGVVWSARSTASISAAKGGAGFVEADCVAAGWVERGWVAGWESWGDARGECDLGSFWPCFVAVRWAQAVTSSSTVAVSVATTRDRRGEVRFIAAEVCGGAGCCPMRNAGGCPFPNLSKTISPGIAIPGNWCPGAAARARKCMVHACTLLGFWRFVIGERSRKHAI